MTRGVYLRNEVEERRSRSFELTRTRLFSAQKVGRPLYSRVMAADIIRANTHY